MKLYVLDDNGSVAFEFSPEGGGHALASSDETRAKVILLIKAAVRFLMMREKKDDRDRCGDFRQPRRPPR